MLMYDFQVFEKSLRPDTGLVSIMMVNNEIGVKQHVAEIGESNQGTSVTPPIDTDQWVHGLITIHF